MWIFESQSALAVVYFLANLSLRAKQLSCFFKKACRMVEEKNGTMFGHLCLVNDNSEINNNQNNIQIIFLIFLSQALIFLFRVNSFVKHANLISAKKCRLKLNNRITLVSLLLNLNTKCFYCCLWTSNCLLGVEID